MTFCVNRGAAHLGLRPHPASYPIELGIEGLETPRLLPTLLLLTLAALPAPGAAQSAFPPDSTIREMVEQLAPVPENVAVVIGLLEPDGSRRIVTVGDAPWDGRTRLEVPSRGGEITLAHLSTHASGLPRLPANMRFTDWGNPYADYTVQELYAFLGSHTLRRDVGAAREYSNLGVGLLGHALALRADTSWEALVRERVLAPLGMSSTMVAIPDSLRPLLAPGHDDDGGPVSNWDLPTLAGAGALRSSADDMLTWLEAHLSPPRSGPLGRPILVAQGVRSRWGRTEVTGLGWVVGTTSFDRPIVAHGGATGGYRAFVAFDPERRLGVVVLTNQARDVTGIARHLLDPRTPASTADLERGFAWMAVVLAALLVAGVFVAWRRTGAARRSAVWASVWTAVALAVWMVTTGGAALFGRLHFDGRPPTMPLFFIVMLALSIGLGLSPAGRRLALGLPLWVLVGVQAFRLPLELLLHRAWEYGLMPVQMSYGGLNFDIVTGALAIPVALLLATGRVGLRTARAWNLLGILLLLNIMTLAWLSAPTPLRVFRNSPDSSIVTVWPYIWLPAVMVAFAILGHVVLTRRLRAEGGGVRAV